MLVAYTSCQAAAVAYQLLVCCTAQCACCARRMHPGRKDSNSCRLGSSVGNSAFCGACHTRRKLTVTSCDKQRSLSMLLLYRVRAQKLCLDGYVAYLYLIAAVVAAVAVFAVPWGWAA